MLDFNSKPFVWQSNMSILLQNVDLTSIEHLVDNSILFSFSNCHHDNHEPCNKILCRGVWKFSEENCFDQGEGFNFFILDTRAAKLEGAEIKAAFDYFDYGFSVPESDEYHLLCMDSGEISMSVLCRSIELLSPSMQPMKTLRIATRKSALALWQAEHVAARLRALHPNLTTELVPMTTRGDQILDRPLAAIGGKGLFLKELEIAMLEQRADIAVHSFKDVPMELEPDFAIGAVLERASPDDAFISPQYACLGDLPQGARVGTSSLRRQAQLRWVRPDLCPVDLRGNVFTRLAKLKAGEYAAIILACAGLERIGQGGSQIRSRLTAPEWLPAAAQGAIAIECRAGDTDTLDLLRPLDDAPTRRCTTAERAMTLALQGNCAVPIAAYCVETQTGLYLWGLVGDAADGRLIRAHAPGLPDQPEALGQQVAALLRERGADALLGRADTAKNSLFATIRKIFP